MKKRVLFFAVVAMFAAIGWAKPELVVQEGFDGTISYLKYTSDGRFILSSTNKTLQIWESESGALIKSIKKYDNSQAVFSESGNYCVFVSPEGTPVLYNCSNGQLKTVDPAIKESDGYISVSISPNESYIAVSIYGKLVFYKLNTLEIERIVSTNPYGRLEDLTFTNDSCFVVGMTSKMASNKINNCAAMFSVSGHFIKAFEFGDYSKNLCLSVDGAKLAGLNGDMDLLVYDIKSKARIGRVKMSKSFRGYRFSIDGKKIISAESTGCYSYDISVGDKKVLIENSHLNSSMGMFESVDLSPGAKRIAFGVEGKKILQFSFSGNNVEKEEKTIAGASELWKADYIFDKKLLYLNADYVFLFDETIQPVEIPESLRHCIYVCSEGLLGKENAGHSIVFYPFFNYERKVLLDYVPGTNYFFDNPSCDRLAFTSIMDDDKNVYVYDLKKTSKPKSFSIKENNTWKTSFSPKGKFLYLETILGGSKILNLENGKTIKTNCSKISFSNDDSYCLMYNEKNRNIEVYDTATWKVLKTFDGYRACFSPDRKYILADGLRKSSIYEFSTGRKIRDINNNNGDCIAFLQENSVCLFWHSYDKALKFYSAKTGDFLASLIADSNGDWFVYTPEGYFNGSEGGIRKFVHVVDGMKVSDLDQYGEVFYRPDLVSARLRGEDISGVVESVIPNGKTGQSSSALGSVLATGDAPLVRFVNPPASSASRDVNVTFTVQDQGGGIGGVYITLNGKVIQIAEGARRIEAVSASQKAAGKTLQFNHTLTLQNGENLIEAYADNVAGKIQSRRASAKITWKGSVSKPSLHVLSVGVNKYRDKSLWLQYSVPDAQAVAQAFAGQKTSLYQNVYTYQLLDGDVTKENLLAQFNTISSKVAADDVFVLFVAGHGTAHQKTGDYYFLPANFRYTDSEAIASQGVSKDDILKYMKNIKAGKTLIMLDTCNSGAFTNDKAMRGVAEKTALDRLCHSTGQAILTAASEEQSAMEGYNGHGIFTYVLLEALSGKADRNKDGYITLNELASYIDEQVPELSYQKWGYEQVPMKELRKQDFPLVGK